MHFYKLLLVLQLLTYGTNTGIQYSYAMKTSRRETEFQHNPTEPTILEEIDLDLNSSGDESIVIDETPLPTQPPRIAPTISGRGIQIESIEADVEISPPIRTFYNQSRRTIISSSSSSNRQRGNMKRPDYTQSFDFMDNMKERMNNNGHNDDRRVSNNGHTSDRRNIHRNSHYYTNRGQTNARISAGREPIYRRISGSTSAVKSSGGAVIAEEHFNGGGIETPLSDRRPNSLNDVTDNNVVLVSPDESVYVSGGTVSRSYYRWRVDEWTECSVTCGSGRFFAQF